MSKTNDENEYTQIITPFFSVTDQSTGSISYEIHQNNGSHDMLSHVNSIISKHTTENTSFSGTWLLIATWDEVQPHGKNYVSVTLYCFRNNIASKLFLPDQHISGNTGHRSNHLLICYLHIQVWGHEFLRSWSNWICP